MYIAGLLLIINGLFHEKNLEWCQVYSMDLIHASRYYYFFAVKGKLTETNANVSETIF